MKKTIFIAILSTLLTYIEVESKPLKRSIEMNEKNDKDYKISQSNSIENNFLRQLSSIYKTVQPRNQADILTNTTTDFQPLFTDENSSPASNNLITTFLIPLLSRFQFSPQEFFQDSFGFLKDTFTKLSSLFPADSTKARQFSNMNGLANFIGLDDNGFYTDRLEPAGLLGGNGWFANKGGLLGGPGAILSTGPILTDYPTPYKKK